MIIYVTHSSLHCPRFNRNELDNFWFYLYSSTGPPILTIKLQPRTFLYANHGVGQVHAKSALSLVRFQTHLRVILKSVYNFSNI